ncbi:srs domain-containing protein [Neospora caninum Liverpool]|uniref:Srs domain-containing protein n=1 Tax=Neospora caninum (strain Liverpool) TaxID=572307 RepID=F0VA48_NEOCL|nr:srs domain-containing protein [Neospora caninum Liverpool]CBZ50537.1 srs domain-containing protein [Neospora caninum Liverpool]CEL65147.1 TPA: SRS domain-containing protein [Neospora caninum Liverpool]|eukprot:XP_003880570.1 srs domain-containing protein [Neospora caninum Liverpool]
MAVCIGGVLLLYGGQAVPDQLREGLQNQSLQQQAVALARLTVKGTDAMCELSAPATQDTAPAAGTLTLSSASMIATLQCSGASSASISNVPENLTQHVCDPKQTSNSSTCKFGNSAPATKEVTLKEVLGTTRTIQWTESKQSERNTKGQKWALELDAGDLPLTDKAFVVGCQSIVGCQSTTSGKSPNNNAACKLTVNVEARASSVGDHNVVTCAYGKNSNPKPLEVDMSTKNNTLTIQCGTEGSLTPTSYTTDYCISDSTDPEACTKKAFVDILPTLSTSWWDTESQTGSAKLTIPETDFPEPEQRLLVGCVPKTKTSQNGEQNDDRLTAKDEPQTQTATPTSCQVLVTVRAASAASYAAPAPTAVIAASGVAVMAAMLVKSL